MKCPLICQVCRGWFEGPDECHRCRLDSHECVVSWNYWYWGILAQVHNLLRSSFRERRGVVTLLGVPPAVGFGLLRHFAHPCPGTNRKGPIYTADHPSYKQGTSKGKKYHFIQYAYNDMEHAEWAFPLGDHYHKTCAQAVRLVSKGRFSDVRWWGTPVQFKYKWAVQRSAGSATQGVHTFTIMANIGHVGLADGLPRWNIEYTRWVLELQLDHLMRVQQAVATFPVRKLRATHKLAGVVHPLSEWVATMPHCHNPPENPPVPPVAATAEPGASDRPPSATTEPDAYAWLEDDDSDEDVLSDLTEGSDQED